MPKVEHILGAILYEKKDYAGAAEQMRSYLRLAPDAAYVGRMVSVPLPTGADGEAIHGSSTMNIESRCQSPTD